MAGSCRPSFLNRSGNESAQADRKAESSHNALPGTGNYCGVVRWGDDLRYWTECGVFSGHRAERFHSRLLTLIYQVPIPIPHLVVATGIVLLVSQSGLLSRGSVALGQTQTPRDFPVMVFDQAGVAIQV